jgi:Tripartite tricarboxylate transporter family receptor
VGENRPPRVGGQTGQRRVRDRAGARGQVARDRDAALPGYVVTGYHLLFVPGATPRDIVARLNAESVKALEAPVTKERLASLGLEPAGGTPADCAKLVKADIERWAPVVKAGGARPD